MPFDGLVKTDFHRAEIFTFLFEGLTKFFVSFIETIKSKKNDVDTKSKVATSIDSHLLVLSGLIAKSPAKRLIITTIINTTIET